jgi:hypothetical protein
MIIVGLKPSPQTQYKYVKPKSAAHFHNAVASNIESAEATPDSSAESLAGCLAWLPVMKLNGVGQPKDGKGMFPKP